MYLSRTVEPATEPVTLTEAKAWLRVEHTDDDTLITALIQAAREKAESITGRALITQTFEYKLDGFPSSDCGITLLRPPFISVTSLGYTDENNSPQTLAENTDFVVTYLNGFAKIILAYEQEWPDTLDFTDVVTVTYVAGYGAASAVPEAIKGAIKVMVADMYENRESLVIGRLTGVAAPVAAENLLQPYRVELYA